MRFILIRHGQTDWNLEKRVQGRTDMPLNAQGIRQAELVAKAVLRYPVERIYASSLERAWETAEIVRRAFLRGIPGTEPRKIPEVIRLPELIEVAFGAWEGKTLDEISRLYPEDYERWVKNPAWEVPTGGEDREALKKRCASAIDIITRGMGPGKDRCVAVVAHGAILVHVIAYLLRHETERREIIVENASITTVDYDPETEMGTLIRMNDTDHLEGGNKTPWKADLRK